MREINPAETKRAKAFAQWMSAPMPMATIFKTINVSNLIKHARRGYKFNMLLCWCIGRAAARTEEFFLLPVGNALFAFDKLAVNAVVLTADGGIETCDIPYSGDFLQFARDYDALTAQVAATGTAHELGGEYMVIGTSALAKYDIDGAVNIYAGVYNNPFLILSFQFHHVQEEIGSFKPERRTLKR